MTQIWERLWVGRLTDARRLVNGNANGITAVISLSELPVETRRSGINYLHLPIEDEEPVALRQFNAIMDALYESIRWGTVLLHCGVGISRAPTTTAAYMDRVGCKNCDAAIQEIRFLRPIIEPSQILMNSVKEILG